MVVRNSDIRHDTLDGLSGYPSGKKYLQVTFLFAHNKNCRNKKNFINHYRIKSSLVRIQG